MQVDHSSLQGHSRRFFAVSSNSNKINYYAVIEHVCRVILLHRPWYYFLLGLVFVSKMITLT
jgi:hypothetical protein